MVQNIWDIICGVSGKATEAAGKALATPFGSQLFEHMKKSVVTMAEIAMTKTAHLAFCTTHIHHMHSLYSFIV